MTQKLPAPAAKYYVYVDDNCRWKNFDFDLEKKRLAGAYGTVEDAIAACESILDRSITSLLSSNRRRCSTAADLYECYTSLGADPFIVVENGPKCEFKAWERAKEMCVKVLESSACDADNRDAVLAIHSLNQAEKALEDLLASLPGEH